MERNGILIAQSASSWLAARARVSSCIDYLLAFPCHLILSDRSIYSVPPRPRLEIKPTQNMASYHGRYNLILLSDEVRCLRCAPLPSATPETVVSITVPLLWSRPCLNIGLSLYRDLLVREPGVRPVAYIWELLANYTGSSPCSSARNDHRPSFRNSRWTLRLNSEFPAHVKVIREQNCTNRFTSFPFYIRVFFD